MQDFEVEGTLDYKNISIFGSIFQYKNIAISIIYHPWKKNILSIANINFAICLRGAGKMTWVWRRAAFHFLLQGWVQVLLLGLLGPQYLKKTRLPTASWELWSGKARKEGLRVWGP